MTNPPSSETLRPTETLEIENGLSLVPRVKLLLTIHRADHSVKPLDEWQLKRSLTDFLKSSFSLTVPEDDIVVRRFKDLKKRKRDDPVAHGALFIRDLGFLSKLSRSEILHGIDGEDDVKELEKKFLGWRRSVVDKTDGIELSLEGVKFRLTASVPESDDFDGMRKEWEELNAFGNRGYSRGGRQQQPDTIVLKGVPSRWFAEPRVSSKPSMLVTHTIFSAFGKIRGTFLCLKMVVTRSKRGNDDDDDDFEVPPTVLQKKKVPKKESKRSKESPSKLNIMHGVRERENYMKQYRSNIVSLINVMRDTRFTKRHITTLERTPFGMLFKCFWKKDDVELKNFKKVDDNVMDVIKCYDFHAKGFKLGGKICDIRDSDVTLIFGIKSGTKKVDVSYGKKQESAFVQRRFPNLSRISVKSLREALGNALEGTTRVDIEDVARIMCLFVVATLLLPTTGLTVGWAFVALVEDLEMMNSYAWSTAVASTLTTSIHSSLGSPENVTGCVLLLLYWLCEHTTLIQPEGKNLCPRLLRWDLSTLRKKLMKKSLQTLKPEEVNHNELKPISKEEMELICNDDEEDALDIEENLETEEDSLDTEEKLETEEDKLDMEEKLETKEGEDDVAEILGDDQPLKNFIDLQKENKRLKSENLALVEELKKLRETMQKMKEEQKAKTKETMEKMSNTEKEMEKLRKEIEVLESENKQLVEQIEENAVHAATQGLSSKEMPQAKGVEQEENIGIQSTLEEIPIVVEPLQTSMVRKIKIKSRKKKEMSDFECEPREAKKKKTIKQGIEVMSKEVICVEDLPLSQAKPVERVLFPDKAAICKLLDEDDKSLLNKIYNLETTDAIIWSGTRHGVYVTLHDVDAILRDGDTANNVIDSFIEMLEIEQQVKKPEKNKSFFFSSLCWSLVKWGYGELRNHLIDEVLAQDLSGYRYLHFCMNSNGNKKDEKPYHWTLLVFDTELDEWRHYNSLRPRDNKEDAYLKDAKKIITYVDSKLGNKTKKGTRKFSNLISVKDSPQQRPTSVDCGIIVCYVMRQIIRDEPIANSMEEDEINNFRASIVHQFLNDYPKAWTEEQFNLKRKMGSRPQG